MNKTKIIYSLASLFLFSALPLAGQAQVVLRNSGEMYVGRVASDTALYIVGNFKAYDVSDIAHPGKTILTGDFINDVTGTSKVFNSGTRAGTFEFRGTAAQTVSFGSNASKQNNYILFPNNVVIKNTSSAGTVTITPSAAAQVKNVTFPSGRLVLDSEAATQANESKVAHLWIEDDATTAIANTDNKANIQVNLALGGQGHMAGFTSPFKTMYADYFFFNFLSDLSETELFTTGNSNELWETNPKRALSAGEGFIIGQGLVPYTNTTYYTNTLNKTQWNGALLSEATTDKFAFNRHLFKAEKTSFGGFISDDESLTARYTGEELLNSDVEDIELAYGYNYLGNPFMVPLNLADLLTTDRSAWGITGTDVAQQYYVLSPGATGNSTNSGVTFTFNATYLVGQTEGSTTLHGRNNLIAPMQMFVLKNNGAAISTFKIPKSKRTHGTTQFLRSSNTAYEPIDELLLEARDMTTGGFDRMCVVFRNGATLKATDIYDAEKLFNRTGGVNQLYTRSTDGKELTTNVLPATTTKLQMYFEPSLKTQEVELEASRLESLRSVYDVTIEDSKTGKKSSFFRNPVYRFTSAPGDSPTRFVLHFTSNPTGTEELTNSELSAWYENGITNIKGLEGENLWIYNAQGLLITKEKVTAPTMQIKRRLDTGVYFIRTENKSVKLYVK
ncbi:hypothetical protein M2459_001568 [Parabacteroides sp. PF5-5]|uniref:T9SS type A sorting domain-containing protein n=1 Tax=unclassified Parabacteroides TaxID=2649774 RepID=UPI002473C893|nr:MULTISPECIES: T9SS type A sorting domain-containing protein [unclassified Parabacteroides]MDH6304832.1 hypothetical protein [Parabacteroides sp. PH5-39]MDH6315554.1 hypothetical protein [Parabacteroides sp. PF5-13]MDH6319214.1 hypothetical protein [Parabacteroides sp. PH5-13]MDH6322945.1 hypothetical protein [Parabacteroides sp. PH5-8]MDH6326747.1 hypothetical protein [Parabacteroides sp. PH5-41]